MSCKKAVSRYLLDNPGTKLPTNSKDRTDWLLSFGWGCKVPDGVTGMSESVCNSLKSAHNAEWKVEKVRTTGNDNKITYVDKGFCVFPFKPGVKDPNTGNKPSNPWCRFGENNECSKTDPKDSGKWACRSHDETKQPLPFYNYWHEEGMAAWSNDRGLKCISSITGAHYGLNEEGNINKPDANNAYPVSRCWGVCQNPTSDSKMCFTCIAEVLSDNKLEHLCPDLAKETDVEDVLSECVECQTCLGKHRSRAWDCVTGDFKFVFTTGIIVAIVIGGIFLIALCIFLGMFFHFKKRPLTAKEKTYLDEHEHEYFQQ